MNKILLFCVVVVCIVLGIFIFIKCLADISMKPIKNDDEIQLLSQSINCPTQVNSPSYLLGCDDVKTSITECKTDTGSCSRWKIKILNSPSPTDPNYNYLLYGSQIQIINQDTSCSENKYLTACINGNNTKVTTGVDGPNTHWKVFGIYGQDQQPIGEKVYSGAVIKLMIDADCSSGGNEYFLTGCGQNLTCQSGQGTPRSEYYDLFNNVVNVCAKDTDYDGNNIKGGTQRDIDCKSSEFLLGKDITGKGHCYPLASDTRSIVNTVNGNVQCEINNNKTTDTGCNMWIIHLVN
jgi:hypothetical protein